jgi:hypothetical protein
MIETPRGRRVTPLALDGSWIRALRPIFIRLASKEPEGVMDRGRCGFDPVGDEGRIEDVSQRDHLVEIAPNLFLRSVFLLRDHVHEVFALFLGNGTDGCDVKAEV